MRLIDADNLRFSEGVNMNGILYVPFGEISKSPTVDAVEVVRCGECKYYISQWKSDDEQVYGLCGIHGTADLKSTDYCSYGERKEASECVK